MDEALLRAIAEGRGVKVRLVAEAAGVTPNTIYQMIRRGQLEAYEAGRAKRVKPKSAARLLGLEVAA